MNMAPAPELLVFMGVAPVSVRFHTLIFLFSRCSSSSVENKLNQVGLNKTRRICQTFLSDLIR